MPLPRGMPRHTPCHAPSCPAGDDGRARVALDARAGGDRRRARADEQGAARGDTHLVTHTYSVALHCTAPSQGTALYATPHHTTRTHAERCARVHYSVASHCIASHCIALHCIALHCIALHRIAHCIALHPPRVLCKGLAVRGARARAVLTNSAIARRWRGVVVVVVVSDDQSVRACVMCVDCHTHRCHLLLVTGRSTLVTTGRSSSSSPSRVVGVPLCSRGWGVIRTSR